MTQDALNYLHLQNKATPNKLYYGDDGKTYIGTSLGRLRLLDKAEIVTFKPTESINETTVQEAIEDVNNSSIKSVTGLNTDNTDSQNPIIEISVDGTSITGDGTPSNPLVANITPGYISSISDTNTVDLDVTTSNLTANVLYQTTTDIVLGDDSSGLKADFASHNISQFTNDVPYLTSVVGYVPTSRTLSINGSTQDLSANRTWTVGDALVANPLSQFASTTSSQLAGVLSDETGTGLVVFNNSPTLITPSLGVATATSINSNTIGAGSTSGTNTGDQTNISGNAATVTTNANLTGPITSIGNATSITNASIDLTTKVTGVLPYANGGMDASWYRNVNMCAASMSAAVVTGTYFLNNSGGAATLSGSSSATTPSFIYISSSDFPSINGKVPLFRISVVLKTNATAPTNTLTFGLYPITAGGGAATVSITTLGTVVTGSNGASQAAPSASTIYNLTSSDFSLPANGTYVIGVVSSVATTAVASFTQMSAVLQVHNP